MYQSRVWAGLRALEYLGKSSGIQKTKELAAKHARLAAAAIGSLPQSDDREVLSPKHALVELTERVVSINK